MIISGSYGRDYTSRKAILEDWNKGLDFIVRDFMQAGRAVNKADAEAAGITSIQVRYKRDVNVTVIKNVKGVWK